jgi:hypothetical protein
VFRKFELALAEEMYVYHYTMTPFNMGVLTLNRPEKLPFRDTFLPYFYGKHLRVNMQPVKA